MTEILTGERLEKLRGWIQPLDTEERRQRYLEGDFARPGLVKNLNRRYRWDLFYDAVNEQRYVELLGCQAAVVVLTDAHIETALRGIVPEVVPG